MFPITNKALVLVHSWLVLGIQVHLSGAGWSQSWPFAACQEEAPTSTPLFPALLHALLYDKNEFLMQTIVPCACTAVSWFALRSSRWHLGSLLCHCFHLAFPRMDYLAVLCHLSNIFFKICFAKPETFSFLSPPLSFSLMKEERECELIYLASKTPPPENIQSLSRGWAKAGWKKASGQFSGFYLRKQSSPNTSL